MPATGSATRDVWYQRAARTGHWLRDSGLGMVGVALLVAVAGAGWGGSTIGLHNFAATRMGYEGWSAWLVPATFDGASVGLSIAAFRAAVHGRGAPLTRLGIVAFTGLSSWMNYERVGDTAGRHIAMLLPVAGVVLLESLLAEARRAYERRHGVAARPRLHPLRVLFDWRGTWGLWRQVVLAIPLPDSMQIEHVTPTTATSAGRLLASVPPLPPPRQASGGGEKVSAMREVFDRYVAEGRLDSLSGSGLARAVGANPSLGRRYRSVWVAELSEMTGEGSDGGA